MPLFHYEAYDQKGALQKGVISACSEEEAKQSLSGKQLLLKKLTEGDSVVSSITLSTQQTVQMLSQLAKLIDAGFALFDALIALKECVDPKVVPLVTALCDKIETGSSFSQALSQFPRAFDSRLCATITAAEHSGKLSHCLHQITEMLARQERWKKQLTGALIYPALLLVMTFGVVILMLIVVVPSLEPLFAGKTLSGLTEFVLAASRFVRSEAMRYLIGLLLLVLVFLGYRLRNYRSEQALQQLRESFWERGASLPLIGSILYDAALARFAQVMAMLLQSGVRLIDALDLASRPLPSKRLRSDLSEVRKKITAGQPLSSALEMVPWFPGLGVNMIRLGEQSGSLSDMFIQISDFYDQRLSERLSRVSALAQPVILIIMGVVVGLLMMAILTPLTDLSHISL